MRRIWAYIVLAFTALVLVGTTFVGEVTKINSSNQFENGREITFRISDKDEESVEFTDSTAVDNIAAMMKKRLDASKVTSYEVLTAGYNTVKVKLSEQVTSDYSNMITLLSFNGNLGLTYGDDALTASEFLLDGKKATISTYNGYPAILLPVNTTPVDELLQVARDDMSENDHTYAEESSSSSSDSETTYKYYLYLWYDYEEGKCTFEAATSSDNVYNSRLLMKFEITDSDETPQYYDDDDDNRLFSLINLDTNSDGSASVSEKTAAYKNARFFINLINAGEIDYKVQYMFQERIDASIESLLGYGGLSWSQMTTATLFTIVILALLLVVFYRLGALAIGTITISSAYLGLLSIIWFSAEFSIFSIFAIVAVSIASLASGAVYMAKLKSEAYRGRSLKKANTEAFKRALLPIVDINVIVVVFGVFAYLFGGAVFRSFGAITVIGGLASLLLNTLGLKAMMWLATNASSVIDKYEMFGIDSHRVPNIINEEKQSYFGAYADKDLTKKHKVVSVITSLLFVACLGGSITFACLNNGNAFVNQKTNYASQIYFETSTTSDTEKSALDENSIYNILSHVYLYERNTDGTYTVSETPLYDIDTEGAKTSNNRVASIYIPDSYSEVVEEQTIVHYYYVVRLNKVLTSDALGLYNDGTIVQTADGQTLNANFDLAISSLGYDSNKTSASLKALQTSKVSSVSYGSVALAVGVSIAVLGLYFMLRYRLSRGLASIVVTVGVSGIILGILSLVRLPVSSLVLCAVPVVAMIAMIISVMIMNREREMILDDKNHDNSVENRQAISIKATSFAFTCASAFAIFAGWIAISFFGFGPDGTAWSFALLFVGVILSVWMVTTLLSPVSCFFYKRFKNIKFTRKPRKSKKAKNPRANKSAEPEEAVFIGIND